MTYDTARPYLAVNVILQKDGKIAFVKRSSTGWMDGYYCLPSGKVEKDEPILQAAIREAKEEVGVTVKNKDLQHVMTVHRKTDDATMSWIDVYFEADSWEGEPYNAEPFVHSELAWLDAAALPETVVPGVKQALDDIRDGLHYTEYGWPA